jgi:hypothetical protein
MRSTTYLGYHLFNLFIFVTAASAAEQDRLCSYEQNLPYTLPATDLEGPVGVVP